MARVDGMAKRFRADPLFFLALAACLGILLADWISKAAPWGAAFLVLSLVTVAANRAFAGWLIWPLAVTAFATVHAWHIEALQAFPHHESILTKPEGLQVNGVGRVRDQPRAVGQFAEQAALELHEITIQGETYQLPHHVLLRLSGHSMRYGEVVAFSGRLALPEPPANPGQFDYRTYLRRHDWVGVLDVGRVDRFEVIDRKPYPLKVRALNARERMASAITRELEEESEIRGVLTAMVLGMREQTTPEMELPFRQSGTLHIFAVSGLHVGIFALIAWLILKPFGLTRAQVAFVLIPLLFSYAFVTGWRPSAVRAATMATVFLAAFCLHREPRLLNSLGLAALLILLTNTNQFFLPGFQLSFAVLLAIIGFTKLFQRPFRSWLRPDPLIPTILLEEHEQRAYAFRRWAGDIVSVSAAAWLGSLPLMAATFHLVTPVAVFANCLLMPLGFFILLTAAMSMLCSFVGILGALNVLFNNANFALVHVLVWLAETFSNVPGGHFLVSNRLPFTRPPIEVTVLDLSRGGAAAHVQVKWGVNEWIDVGHEREFLRVTEPYLREAGLNSLDRLWLTHGDVGHVGAAPVILQSYKPQVYRAPWDSRSPSMRSVEGTLEERQSPARLLHAGQSVPLGEQAYWEVLYPPAEENYAPGAADDRGLVLRLCVHDWRVLFMADAGFLTEQWLLNSDQDVTADVLIKGHHEDDVSGIAAFLARVRPKVIVADSETQSLATQIAWADAQGCQIFDQREVGAVILGLSESEISVRGFRGDQEVFLNRAR